MIGALEWRADGSGFDLWVIVIFVLVIKHTYPTQYIPLFRRICENQKKKNCQRMLQRTSKSSARWSNNSLGPFMTRKLSNVWQICSRIDGILCLIRLFFQILRKGNPPLLRMRMSFREVFLVLSGEYLKVIFTRDAIGRRYFFSQQIKKCPKPCIALMAIRLNTGKTSSQTPWKKPPSQWPWKKVSSPD